MTQHALQGRSEADVLWFRRRSVLQAGAAWVAAGGFGAALAQQRGNVVELRGEVLANGRALRPQDWVQTGDELVSGPGSHLVFVLGNAAFLLRPQSRLVVERGDTINAASVLRLLTGAVASVWNRGGARQIVTPTLTAGIRGTGVYTEVFAAEDSRTYFCNCYGEVALAAGFDRALSQAAYHQSFWAEPVPREGRRLRPAQAINHTDEELEFLAALAGQQTAWQRAGRKGVKDGQGYMEQRPADAHPAMRLR